MKAYFEGQTDTNETGKNRPLADKPMHPCAKCGKNIRWMSDSEVGLTALCWNCAVDYRREQVKAQEDANGRQADDA